ncbi:hypothetical protein F5Y10DRAFT_260212 [Nemania abortiva]|nr:hypothetical protein F5Y10DRAFT_260212 [Nemania abortiva]
MAGNHSTKPADSAVLAAMMNDLGNKRLEDLLREGDSGPAHSANPTITTRPVQPRHGALRTNDPARAWHAAIDNGDFDDDDAAGVQGLDTLDGGNAHRVRNHTSRPPFGSLSNQKRVNDATGSSSKRPKYDPSQPTYRRGGSRALSSNTNHLPTMSRHPGTNNGTFRVSSLGGIIPDGGEVRRWDTGRQAGTTDNPFQNLPAGRGRGRPVCSPIGSPEGLHASTAGRGHGKDGYIPNSPICGSQLQPPHLRTAIEAASQVPLGARQASTHLTGPAVEVTVETTAEAIVIDQTENVRKSTTLDAREIFFSGEVLLPRRSGVDDKPAKGRIVIYELLATPVGIWELTIEGKEVIRGDIRELLEVLHDGSKVFLRRYPNKTQVRSEPLRFSDVNEARIFTDEANIRRNQYCLSSAPIHAESSSTITPAQSVLTPGAAGEVAREAAAPSVVVDLDKVPAIKDSMPLPQEPKLEGPAPEEPNLGERANGYAQPKAEPRPHSPSIPPAIARVESTPMKSETGSHKRTGSGWSDSDLINLSPNSAHGSRGGYEQPQTAGIYTTLGAGTPKGWLIDQEEDAAEQTIKALRDVKIIDDASIPTGKHYQFLFRNSSYTLVRKSKLLAMALEGSSSQAEDTAYAASLLHLVELDDFLQLPRDDQKNILAVLYAVVRRGDSRIIRTPDEIYALRTGWESCPREISHFNLLVKGGWSKAIPQPVFRDPTPGESSDETASKCSEGLLRSRWANSAEDKTETIVDRKANSHQRSSTNGTMSILADQLNSLSVGWGASL